MPQKGYTDILVLSLMDDLLEVYSYIPSLFVATKSILAHNEASGSGLEIEVEKYYVEEKGGPIAEVELDSEWSRLGYGGDDGGGSNEYFLFNRHGALVEVGYKVPAGIFRIIVVDPHHYSKTDYGTRQQLLLPHRTEGIEQLLGLDIVTRPSEENGYSSEVYRDFGRRDRLTPVMGSRGPIDEEGFHRLEIYHIVPGKEY